MATFSPEIPRNDSNPNYLLSSCEFHHVLTKLQRATHLIASTLELDALLERVVNDIATTIGNIEVGVWLLAPDATDEMVLHGVRGCTVHKKGSRLKVGADGMVGYTAATGTMRYAPDVH